MQTMNPLVKEIGHLIDKRFQTFETIVKAEIKESEERVTDKLTKKIESVEGRLTGVEGRLTGVEGRLTGVEGRLTGVEKRLESVESKLDRGLNNHKQRIERLERHAAISA